jgi:A/G-specific adenine glycosylase
MPWRKTGEPVYRLVVSEVLLQRTRAEAVAAMYRPFFRAFPSWRKLATADDADLERFLKPLGLWRRRRDVLLRLAAAVGERGGRLPKGRQEIERLPGVGQYIANAIQLFATGLGAPLLDVNMARVLERYFGPRRLADIRYDSYLQALAWEIVSHGDARPVNWGILDLAAAVCTSREARCNICPLRRGCNFARGISCARDDDPRVGGQE